MNIRRSTIRLTLALLLVVLVAPTLHAAVPDGAEDDTSQRYVFVINRLGARPVALANIRNALEAFTKGLGAGDEVMVVEIGYSSRVLLELTSSKEAALETIRNLTPLPVNVSQRLATRQLYYSLRGVAERLRALPGRKAVILASREPNLIRSGVHYVRDTVDALNLASASVYSVDLDVFRLPFGRSVAQSGLAALALDTGGRYFFTQSRTSFLPALYQIADELESDAVVAADR